MAKVIPIHAKYPKLEERLRIAREINAYREAHPKMLLSEVLMAMELAGTVSHTAYWAWRKRLELADATRKANVVVFQRI